MPNIAYYEYFAVLMKPRDINLTSEITTLKMKRAKEIKVQCNGAKPIQPNQTPWNASWHDVRYVQTKQPHLFIQIKIEKIILR